MNVLNKGQELLLTIKRIGINGEGIGYYKRLAVFVKGALPKEECLVRITKVENTYSEAELLRIKNSPSPDRIEPKCKYFGKCGGCDLQHAKYEYQLQLKHDILVESFDRYYDGKLNPVLFKETIGMDDPWHYRNKAKLPVRFDGENIVTGLYEGNSNILVYIDNCVIEDIQVRKIVDEICKYLTKSQIIAYHPKSKEGVLRHIVVRTSRYTGESQVTLILYKKDKRTIDIASKMIGIKGIDSVYYSINDDADAIESFGHDLTHLSGKQSIKERLGNLEFYLLPNSFFQLNIVQTEKLYDEVLKLAKLSGNEKVFDAYSGVGTIGCWLAKSVKEVRGVDIVKEAIINANDNVKLNNIENAKYYTGDVLQKLDEFAKEGWVPDVFIVDPPRTGMEIRLLNYLQKHPIKKIIYVSCNSATLAKNCNHLQKIYHILKIQPLDMFPQTSHVETVVLLTLKNQK